MVGCLTYVTRASEDDMVNCYVTPSHYGSKMELLAKNSQTESEYQAGRNYGFNGYSRALAGLDHSLTSVK